LGGKKKRLKGGTPDLLNLPTVEEENQKKTQAVFRVDGGRAKRKLARKVQREKKNYEEKG